MNKYIQNCPCFDEYKSTFEKDNILLLEGFFLCTSLHAVVCIFEINLSLVKSHHTQNNLAEL